MRSCSASDGLTELYLPISIERNDNPGFSYEPQTWHLVSVNETYLCDLPPLDNWYGKSSLKINSSHNVSLEGKTLRIME